MTFNKPKTNGFSLIEVMVAVLILSVGILAVSKLQTSLIRSGSDANQRSVAAGIVQKKIDDLRRFAYVNTSATLPALPEWEDLSVHALTSLKYPNSLSFANIATNQGGRMQAGTIFNGNNTYELSWTSDSYYYNGTNQIATTDAVTLFPAFKTAHVKVTWQGVGDNTTSVVSFDTVIDAYNLANTDLGGAIPAGGSSPIVAYNPLSAPDVVPVELGIGDLKKETSKPLPDVSKKGDSTMVKFETVTYNTNNNTQRREEFRTLACKCTTSGSTKTSSYVYGYVTWDHTEDIISDITTKVNLSASDKFSKIAVDNSGGEVQDDACTTCCRDSADLAGDFKVCRLKRIDGVLRLITPWKLVAFNMIPASYFNDSDGLSAMTTVLQSANIARYSSYVTTTVRSILAGTGSPSAFASYTEIDGSFINDATSFTNNSGNINHLDFISSPTTNYRNIQVRGVYMDYPPTGIFTQIINQSTYYSATNVPLDRVPFYEVNLTQLAGWVPDVNILKSGSDTGDQSFTVDYPDQHDAMDNSCVQPDDPSAGRNYVTNEDFFYSGGGGTTTCINASRGEFHPISPASAESITSEIYTGSDGIVDRNITGNTTVDISLDLQVD